MIQHHTFTDARSTAIALAQAVADGLRDTLSRQPHATLAVSGGRSPIAFFQALNTQDLDWSRVNITLVDERIVPTTHNDSNTALVREYLLQNRAAAARWLPLIADGELAPTPAVALPFAQQHFVQPDVVVLGMGADGHTASLFPQAPQLSAALAPDAPALLHTSPVTAPHERLTLSLPAIERATAVFLAIGGAEKLAVYQQAAERARMDLPVSLILHSEKVRVDVYSHP
ncbi:6-phosphogluconolactonase [Conchiformibius steedae]|uniref:6-phosphogluconolactonase n=1 Tax=Conchiformibius steedae TaxID=153493 RepID=UPI0026F35055|nr:6-phosphogluconolactonase [Conchiformibius steedae]